MRWRVLFFFSLGVNLAAALVLFVSARRLDVARKAVREQAAAPAATTTRTNVLVRRQFFTWAEVESPDYPTYIANLRDIGCPEQTIRDIIIADVNTLYSRRLATELITPDQQWWRSEPDTNVVHLATEKARALEEERRTLLTRLLGPNWESGDLINLPRPTHPGITLDGPVLGNLPMETKRAIQDIYAQAQERLQTYVEGQRSQGKNPDPADLARLRQQTRNELAGILAPAQLEEYLLRYSQNANDLRNELGQLDFFAASPEEFRAMFRATDVLNQQLDLLAGGTDANSILARRNLELQRDNALKISLGADRYKQFALLHDPAYRDAYAAAQQAGTPDAAQTLYEINLATAQQQATMLANTNLTAEQRAIELKRIELEKLKAAAQAMGQEVAADATAAATQPAAQGPSIRTHPYVLAVGETVSSIAFRYNVSVNAIKAANPDLDLRRVKAGDAIQVPDSLPSPPQ